MSNEPIRGGSKMAASAKAPPHPLEEAAERFDSFDSGATDEQASALADLHRVALRWAAVEADLKNAVEYARHRGVSWNTIGRRLGVSSLKAIELYGE